ncbi:flagellar basal body rod C-terminal domain-containing protein [Ferroacidibacillus organovorans]|uniref:Flagellar basal body protein n=1 Tax=Ferroacidibacillus organovorans TaxID=1765683 RepID=A0A101XPW2_9BACL|nr:flagellar basal body rod C-terminal domain-containing protein [Ferroacidibacillus organovorans]KUO95244.1 hypothetical protein ATW55_13990 [Ferroacidibacillus organovorans]
MDGLSSAASGMLADERLQQVIMNNIANLSTPGFKQSSGQLMSFPEQLAQRYSLGSNGAGAVTLGTLQNGAYFQESVSNFSPGIPQTTNRPLDLALIDPASTGDTVYAQTAKGPAPVSTTQFIVGRGGVIETGAGQPILPVDANGAPIAGARVLVNPAYHGAALFGASGSPVVDAQGNESYRVVSKTGQPLTVNTPNAQAAVQIVSSQTGGVHAFFPVLNVDAQGKTRLALTRDGQLSVGGNGFLVSSTGQALLGTGANGQVLLGSRIKLNPAYQGTAIFSPTGGPVFDQAGHPSYTVVNTNGQPIAGGTFAPVNVDVQTIQPLGANEYVLTPASTLYRSNATVKSGTLETSNASGTQNMVDMINVYRSYEANQKMIQMIDKTLSKTVQDVGSVPNL